MDQGGLSFCHPLGYMCFLEVSVHFDRQSVIDRSEFLKQYPCTPSWPDIFQFGTFLSIALSQSMCIFTLCPILCTSNSFPMLLIQSAFLLCFLPSHILLWFFIIQFLVCGSCIQPLLAARIFFRCFGNVLFSLYASSCLNIFF